MHLNAHSFSNLRQHAGFVQRSFSVVLVCDPPLSTMCRQNKDILRQEVPHVSTVSQTCWDNRKHHGEHNDYQVHREKINYQMQFFLVASDWVRNHCLNDQLHRNFGPGNYPAHGIGSFGRRVTAGTLSCSPSLSVEEPPRPALIMLRAKLELHSDVMLFAQRLFSRFSHSSAGGHGKRVSC